MVECVLNRHRYVLTGLLIYHDNSHSAQGETEQFKAYSATTHHKNTQGHIKN